MQQQQHFERIRRWDGEDHLTVEVKTVTTNQGWDVTLVEIKGLDDGTGYRPEINVDADCARWLAQALLDAATEAERH
jgi:hypothetical protein